MMATIIDSVIIVLLLGSVAYGYLVSRRVHVLMATLRDLEPLVVQFSNAVDKSEHSVSRMRENISQAEEASYRSAPAPAERPEPALSPREAAAAFASRRAPAAEPEPEIAEPQQPGMRVVRNKQDMVRAFFDSSSAARA